MAIATHSRLVEVMREARALLARPDNDFVWSSWDDQEVALRQIDGFISRIEAGDIPAKMDLIVLFAPTGNIQEVAESSGWGVEFLDLAKRFDGAIKSI